MNFHLYFAIEIVLNQVKGDFIKNKKNQNQERVYYTSLLKLFALS